MNTRKVTASVLLFLAVGALLGIQQCTARCTDPVTGEKYTCERCDHNDSNDCTADLWYLPGGDECAESNRPTVDDGTACTLGDGTEGICQAGSCGTGVFFPCTEQGIRDAIAEGGGPHMFACSGPMTVTTQAEIVIDNDVILDGLGDLTVDGNNQHRVFFVEPTVTAELRGFTVQDGSTPGDGGGINNEGTLTLTNSVVSGNEAEFGGGIYNDGILTLTNTTISGNNAQSRGGGIISYPYASMLAAGTLILTNCSVSGNTAARLGGGVDAGWGTLINTTVSGNTALEDGGGIYGYGSLTNTTVSGNTAGNRGGGIFSFERLALTNSTLSGNHAPQGSTIYVAGLFFYDHFVEIAQTLIDGECAQDAGVVTWISNGHNIESPGDTCGFDQPTDLVVPDPMLGPLADNGGPTQTHALLPGSPAIDRIPVEDCVDADGLPVTEDQRGEPRPAGDGCDVGAFEVQP